MHKNNDNFIEYNIIISFLNKKRYRKRKKLRYIVHLILYMDIKILNVHLGFNSTLVFFWCHLKPKILIFSPKCGIIKR